MAEYSRIAKGSFVSTGASKVINLPFKPDYVEMWNYTAALAAPILAINTLHATGLLRPCVSA